MEITFQKRGWRVRPAEENSLRGDFSTNPRLSTGALVVLSAPLKRRSPEGDRREPFSFFHLWTVMRFQGSFDLRPIVKQPIARARPQRLEGSRAQMDCDVDAQTSTCGFLSIIGVFGTIKVRNYVIVTQKVGGSWPRGWAVGRDPFWGPLHLGRKHPLVQFSQHTAQSPFRSRVAMGVGGRGGVSDKEYLEVFCV